MFRIMGYTIDRAPSQLFGGGTGVFVTKGIAKKGQLVALYPGNDLFWYSCNYINF